MQAYLDLLNDIRDHGVDRGDRTGTGTRSVFGRHLRLHLDPGDGEVVRMLMRV